MLLRLACWLAAGRLGGLAPGVDLVAEHVGLGLRELHGAAEVVLQDHVVAAEVRRRASIAVLAELHDVFLARLLRVCHRYITSCYWFVLHYPGVTIAKKVDYVNGAII